MRDIPGLEGRYAATNDGRIWSYKRRKFRAQSLQRSGYLTISVKENGKHKTLSVHRLIALAWLENPENLPQVNHKDGVKTNNSRDNLEWCTGLHNSRHAWSTGLSKMTHGMMAGLRAGWDAQQSRPRVQRKPRVRIRRTRERKLSAEQLNAIAARVKNGEMQKDIAAEIGVSRPLLCMRLKELTNKECR